MLIQALSDYYDILSAKNQVLPEGYSNVKISYKVCLNEQGEITNILDVQNKTYNEKGKVILSPSDMYLPKRTEKPGIDSNVIEHRPLYVFGLNYEEKKIVVDGKTEIKAYLTTDDKTNKAKKSHDAFVERNLQFIEGLDSSLINAFRNFLLKWSPKEQVENPYLMGLKKQYGKAGFVFCLSGNPDKMLQDDALIKERWEEEYQQKDKNQEGVVTAQCGISGEENVPIARIHNKIKGVVGGLATGSVLIGYNNSSECSYENEQSYNSNVSEKIMKKYTEALNYLLAERKQKVDDMTVVFWAMDKEETYEQLIQAMIFGNSEGLNTEETEKMLFEWMQKAKEGALTYRNLESVADVSENIDFYMMGLKPNSSRLAIKFIYKKKVAEMLWNIAQFQNDLQIGKEQKVVYMWQISKELVSPKLSNDTVNPALMTKLFQAILYGTNYPEGILQTVVRRVKTDTDISVNLFRAGLIKACLNRNYSKEREVLQVTLDEQNQNQAYVCGRLFAVLEQLQQEASDNKLNRTIKDAYFATAMSKPAMVYPKLMKLAQNHLKKLENPYAVIRYNKQIGEIMSLLNGEFPSICLLEDQGRFIVGYYQQRQKFFESKKNESEKEVKKEMEGN